MKYEKSYHNGASEVIDIDIIDSVTDIIEQTEFEMKRYSVPELKKTLVKSLICDGWSGQFRVDGKTRITITSKKRDVGLCLQLGNVCRIYADLLKLQVLFNKGIIKAGIIIVSSEESAKIMGGNMASFERLEREYPLYEEIISVPCAVLGFYEEVN